MDQGLTAARSQLTNACAASTGFEPQRTPTQASQSQGEAEVATLAGPPAVVRIESVGGFRDVGLLRMNHRYHLAVAVIEMDKGI